MQQSARFLTAHGARLYIVTPLFNLNLGEQRHQARLQREWWQGGAVDVLVVHSEVEGREAATEAHVRGWLRRAATAGEHAAATAAGVQDGAQHAYILARTVSDSVGGGDQEPDQRSSDSGASSGWGRSTYTMRLVPQLWGVAAG